MLIFCDSGDHSNAVVSDGKWSAARNGDFNPSSYGNGRFGTNCVFYTWDGRWMRKDLGANYAHLIVGAAWYVWGDNLPIMGFWDAGTEQLSLWYDAGGQTLYVKRGDGTLLGSTYLANLTATYHFVEWRVKIHDTLGEIEIRLDTTVLASLTGLDTKQTGNAYANQLRIGDHGDNYRAGYVDDLVLIEKDSGTGLVDFTGDVRVQARLPNGNGNSSQLAGSDGNSVDNYLLVDESTPNGDTDYVQSGTVGQKDTYTYQDVTPASGTVFGVQILPSAKRTDTGARSIASVVRLAGTEADGPNKALAGTYSYLPDIRETKPGGGAFSIADVNAMEVGAKVTV